MLNRLSIELERPAIGGNRQKQIQAILIRDLVDRLGLWSGMPDDDDQHAPVLAIRDVAERIRHRNGLSRIDDLPLLDDKLVRAGDVIDSKRLKRDQCAQ